MQFRRETIAVLRGTSGHQKAGLFLTWPLFFCLYGVLRSFRYWKWYYRSSLNYIMFLFHVGIP